MCKELATNELYPYEVVGCPQTLTPDSTVLQWRFFFYFQDISSVVVTWLKN